MASSTQLIAERYARALFALSLNSLESVEKDLLGLKKAIAATPALARLFTNPLLPRTAKATAMDAVLAKLGASDITRRFVQRLSLNQRLAALPDVIAAFERLLLVHRGELVLTVTTAKALDAREAETLHAALNKAYGRKVHVNSAVDPSLIGGMVVNAGGVMIDYSVKNQLSRLKQALKSQAA